MQYKSKLQSLQVDELFEAILELETIEECAIGFEDICTINEVKSLAQRLEVAKMLKSKRTYQDIADKLELLRYHKSG